VTITLLAGAGGKELPAHMVGAVIEEASVVEIRFGDGDVLRVPTFSGAEPLQHVRFYAAQLPADIRLIPETAAGFLTWVAGLDRDGNVVACSAPRTADDGSSSLSDCR
jgi:hypothetical protein